MDEGLVTCYLLTPAFRRHPTTNALYAPTHRGRTTYVGFTTRPWYRLRQHSGELAGGDAPKEHRPWEMVALVHGFENMEHATTWALQCTFDESYRF
jgi:predicted GIY-YIG superfamily endonuclease